MGQPVAADRQARYGELTSAAREAATLEELCQRVAEGETLGDVCKSWDVPYSRVAAWLAEPGKGRRKAYDDALALHADSLVAQCVPLADAAGDDVALTKLQIDARFKAAAKYDRARFGESVQHTGKKDEPLFVLQIAPGDDSVI